MAGGADLHRVTVLPGILQQGHGLLLGCHLGSRFDGPAAGAELQPGQTHLAVQEQLAIFAERVMNTIRNYMKKSMCYKKSELLLVS